MGIAPFKTRDDNEYMEYPNEEESDLIDKYGPFDTQEEAEQMLDKYKNEHDMELEGVVSESKDILERKGKYYVCLTVCVKPGYQEVYKVTTMGVIIVYKTVLK
jgi:preprotein translocase subunit Sss1